ncbi:MAG: hypothetical protein QM743_02785 [Chitinophagaceae bacterium]
MKKCWFILLLLLLCAKGFAQTVFAPDGAVWHFEHIADFEPSGQNYSRYAKEKDTMYFGHLCAKIPGKKIAINTSGSGYDTTELETQYTYTNGDTVFYYNHVFDRFLILYRFDVKAGDTVIYHHPFKMPARYDTVFKVVIDSVKIQYIDGMPLRNIRSTAVEPSPFTLNSLTERIGPIEAFSMLGYRYQLTFPEGGGLRCYSDLLIDTNTGYLEYACEELSPLSVREFHAEASPVFPDPCGDVVHIPFTLNTLSDVKVMMMSLDGHVTIQREIGSLHSGEQIIDLDVSKVPAGNYICSVKVSNGSGTFSQSRMFVKQ